MSPGFLPTDLADSEVRGRTEEPGSKCRRKEEDYTGLGKNVPLVVWIRDPCAEKNERDDDAASTGNSNREKHGNASMGNTVGRHRILEMTKEGVKHLHFTL